MSFRGKNRGRACCPSLKNSPSRRRFIAIFFFFTAFTCRLDNSQGAWKNGIRFCRKKKKKKRKQRGRGKRNRRKGCVRSFLFFFWYAWRVFFFSVVINRKNKGVSADPVSVLLRPPTLLIDVLVQTCGLAPYRLEQNRSALYFLDDILRFLLFYFPCRFFPVLTELAAYFLRTPYFKNMNLYKQRCMLLMLLRNGFSRNWKASLKMQIFN